MNNIAKISKREKQVLDLIAFEYTAKEIARELYVSPNTIETHRRNLLMKLKVRNSAGLIRRSFELGLLQVSV